MSSKTLTCLAISLIFCAPAYAQEDPLSSLFGEIERYKEDPDAVTQEYIENVNTTAKDEVAQQRSSMIETGKQNIKKSLDENKPSMGDEDKAELKDFKEKSLSKIDKKLAARIKNAKAKNKKNKGSSDLSTESIVRVWPKPVRYGL